MLAAFLLSVFRIKTQYSRMKNKPSKIKEYTMSITKVYLLIILLVIPIATITLLPFLLIWNFSDTDIYDCVATTSFLISLIVGMPIHELLHGLTWAFWSKKGLRSIRYGNHWSSITPYCHSKDELLAKHYRIGTAMPLVVMGIAPALLGLLTGQITILIFGFFYIWAAGGDIISLYLLRQIDDETLVYDHPDKLGFLVIDK